MFEDSDKINLYIDKYTSKPKKVLDLKYEDIIAVENLLLAWREFKKGKSKKKDAQKFEFRLVQNILDLHHELKTKTYTHSEHEHFKVQDPKERDIHKASVRDRVIHHLIYKNLYPFFDKLFITDLYSCRVGKGTHKARARFREFLNKESKNYTKLCYVLKCDIRKFFASIDHGILLKILRERIQDKDILNLLENIINSFESYLDGESSIGLPLGNLTSQLLVNIYMNEFDQFVKQKLKVKYYIRYADDFVFISKDKVYLQNLLSEVSIFLENNLKLKSHPQKVLIKSIYSGVDFLGFIFFKNYTILRTSTKRRMFKKLMGNDYKQESLQSYLGMLSFGNCYNLGLEILRECGER